MRPGLCSVTFRALDAEELVRRCADAGLEGIEWGGDRHVPPGEADRARRVAQACRSAGLAIPSYGSYLLAGEPDQPLDAVLETARLLGARTVRVWAGLRSPSDADPEHRRRVASALAIWTERASALDLTLALEFHPGTLTETAASTVALLEDVGDPRLATYWQPVGGQDPRQAEADITRLRSHLAHLHVFCWEADGTRQSLAEGRPLWERVVSVASASPPPGGGERWALLEFVPGDDPDVLDGEAATLRALLDGASEPEPAST